MASSLPLSWHGTPCTIREGSGHLQIDFLDRLLTCLNFGSEPRNVFVICWVACDQCLGSEQFSWCSRSNQGDTAPIPKHFLTQEKYISSLLLLLSALSQSSLITTLINSLRKAELERIFVLVPIIDWGTWVSLAILATQSSLWFLLRE